MRLRTSLAGLALAMCLVVGGCATQAPTSTPAPVGLGSPTTFTVGVGTVEYLESHADRILTANVTSATVALVTTDGRQLFARDFPGKALGSLRLSRTGDRVFVSLIGMDGSGSSALWLDDSGTVLWRRDDERLHGLFEANIASDGRSVALVTLASGTSATGRPDFEIVDDAGRTLAKSGSSRYAVTSVQSSSDLSRSVVTSIIATDTSGDVPPSTVIERYAGTERLDREVFPQLQGSVYLSPSGRLALSTIGGASASLRSWESSAVTWEQPSETASVVTFSTDESRLFVMRIGSSQTGDLVSFSSGMEVRDVANGVAVWNTGWGGDVPLRPVTSPDLRRIAMVPFTGTEGAVLYEASGAAYAQTPLPAGTASACFTDDGRLVLGFSSGTVSLY